MGLIMFYIQSNILYIYTYIIFKPENVLIGMDGIVKLGDYPVVSNWTEFINQAPNKNPGTCIVFCQLL